MYAQLMADFPVATIEDPFDQDDWAGWVEFSKMVKEGPTQAQVVADDLTVTNVTRIRRAIDEKAADCLLLKVSLTSTTTCSIALSSRQHGYSLRLTAEPNRERD